MKWVVDASVAVKWLVTEQGSEAAQALLDDELLVPDIFFCECANVFRKKAARRELTAKEAETAAKGLLLASVEVFASAALTPIALSYAIRLNHPAYDCIYLALARAEGAAFITADHRLYARCQQPDADALAIRVHLLGQGDSESATH